MLLPALHCVVTDFTQIRVGSPKRHGPQSELSSSVEARPFHGVHSPHVEVPQVLIEAHHANAPTRQIYDDR